MDTLTEGPQFISHRLVGRKYRCCRHAISECEALGREDVMVDARWMRSCAGSVRGNFVGREAVKDPGRGVSGEVHGVSCGRYKKDLRG